LHIAPGSGHDALAACTLAADEAKVMPANASDAVRYFRRMVLPPFTVAF
jgi:hypothetical protein